MVDGAPSLEDVLPTLGELLAGPRARRPQRAVRSPRAAPGLRAHRPGVARPAGHLHRGHGPLDAAPAAPARPRRARRRPRDRGAHRAPRAGRRRDLRARAVRAVPAPVRQRRDGRRGPGHARAHAGGRANGPWPLATFWPRRREGRRRLPRSVSRRARARLRRPAARSGRLPVSRRCRARAVRGQVGVDPQPRPCSLRAVVAAARRGPGTRRSWITARPAPSSARSSWRTA